MSLDRFCEHCGISLDLHNDTDQPDPTNCETAEKKAELISQFWNVGQRS